MAETYDDDLSREIDSDGYVTLGSTAALDRTTIASRAAETAELGETGDLGPRRKAADEVPAPAQDGAGADEGDAAGPDAAGPDAAEDDSLPTDADADLGETRLVGAGETLLRPRHADEAGDPGDRDDDDFEGDPYDDGDLGEFDPADQSQTVRSPLPVMGGDERLEQLGESLGDEDDSEEAYQAMRALEERRASRRKAKFVRVGIAAAAIAVAIGGYFAFTALTAPKPEQESYQTATVERTDFTISVQGTGSLRPASQVLVTPEVDGIVDSVSVSEGQFVHEGDVLFTVRSTTVEKAISDAQEALDKAQKDVDRAYEELNKAEATKNTARQNHDNAQRAYEQATASAQAAYDSAYRNAYNKSREDAADELERLNQEVAGFESSLQQKQGEMAGLDAARTAWEAARAAWEAAAEADKPAMERAMNEARAAYDGLGGDARTEELGGEIQTVGEQLAAKVAEREDFTTRVESEAQMAGSTAGEAAKAQVAIPEVPYYDESSYDSAIDASRSTVEAAETARDTAQRTLDQEKENGEKRTVKAPKTGTLISLGASVGGSVGAQASSSSGGSMATIADITQMRVSLEINEVDISKVAAGQRAMVTFSSVPGLEATARVVDVASTASGSGEGGMGGGVAAFTVDCVISMPDSRLKPGMTATVTIYTTDIPNALVVPSSAILDLTGGPFVDVVVDPEATVEEGGVPATDRRKVSTGESNATETVVETGVAEGDEVLIGGLASMGGAEGLAEGDLSSLESLSAEDLGLTEEELAELEALTAE